MTKILVIHLKMRMYSKRNAQNVHIGLRGSLHSRNIYIADVEYHFVSIVEIKDASVTNILRKIQITELILTILK